MFDDQLGAATLEIKEDVSREMKMNSQKLEKWKKWIGDLNNSGSITNDLVELETARTIIKEIGKMVRANQYLQQPSTFYNVLSVCYAHSVLMYIRRQIRRDNDSISLIKLLDDLVENCQMISVDFYIALCAEPHPHPDDVIWNEIYKKTFQDQFGGDRQICLDPEIVKKDITSLEEINKKSASFIDRRVAHLDKKEPDMVPTFDEIESWCDTLIQVFKKYYSLLYAVDFQITPKLNPEWKSIFTVPWIIAPSS